MWQNNALVPILQVRHKTLFHRFTYFFIIIIDVFRTVNDAVSQPRTPCLGVQNIFKDREQSYAVIRTENMKMNLRKVSNPKYHDIDDSEKEDVYAEESSEYEPSDSEESNTSSKSNSSVQSNNENNEQSRSKSNVECSPCKKGRKRTRNPEN